MMPCQCGFGKLYEMKNAVEQMCSQVPVHTAVGLLNENTVTVQN